jgi:hypothetical protein
VEQQFHLQIQVLLVGIELNAIQRSNPEMQKRAANAIRGLVESDVKPNCVYSRSQVDI